MKKSGAEESHFHNVTSITSYFKKKKLVKNKLSEIKNQYLFFDLEIE